jgi:hypothetical protein
MLDRIFDKLCSRRREEVDTVEDFQIRLLTSAATGFPRFHLLVKYSG